VKYFAMTISFFCLYIAHVHAQIENTYSYSLSKTYIEERLNQIAEQANISIVVNIQSEVTPNVSELVCTCTVDEAIQKSLVQLDYEIHWINTTILVVKISAVIEKEPATTPAEIIVVTNSYSDRLANSIFQKRNSIGVKEIISSQDFNGLPDNSIADSLDRLPGVAADRDRGNTSQIDTRGLGSEYALYTFNGREMPTSAPDRDVRFDQFDPTLFSSVVVSKTTNAKMLVGGISASIDLKTIRPLTIEKRVAKIQVNAGNTSLEMSKNNTGNFSRNFNILYIDKMFDSKLGLAIGAFNSLNVSPNTAMVRGAYDNNADWNMDGVLDFAPASIEYNFIDRVTRREGYLAALQWRPSANSEINFDALYTQRADDEDRNSLIFTSIKNYSDSQLGNPVVTLNKVMLSANIGMTGNDIASLSNSGLREDVTQSYHLHLKNTFDDFHLDGALSYSVSERNFEQDVFSAVGLEDFDLKFSDVDLRYDLSTSFDLLNSRLFQPHSFSPQNQQLEDQLVSANIDVIRFIDDSFFTLFEFGILHSKRTKQNERNFDLYTISGFEQGIDEQLQNPFPYDDFLSDLNGTFPSKWILFDGEKIRSTYFSDTTPLGPNTNDLINTWSIDEMSTSLYGMLSFASTLFTYPVYGNIGVRYFSSKSNSKGYATNITSVVDESIDIVKSIKTHSYVNWLPSFSVVGEFDENFMIRVAASVALAKPPIDLVVPKRSIFFNASNQILGRENNPSLDPIRAVQLDVTAEWYFNDLSILTIGLFYKDLEGVIYRAKTPVNVSSEEAILLKPVNSMSGSKVRGVEFMYQQKLTQLNNIFQHTGWSTSLAYTQNTGRIPFNDEFFIGMDGYSKWVNKVSFFYDDSQLSMQLAYRYRSSFVREITQLRVNENEQFVDFILNYKLTKKMTIQLEAMNLLNEPLVLNSYPTNALSFDDQTLKKIEYSGTIYSLGLTYNF
jgi:iron complex outermembrane receptor protein